MSLPSSHSAYPVSTSIGYVVGVPTNPFNNDVSTRDTIHQMIRIARDASNDPSIQTLVNSFISSCQSSYQDPALPNQHTRNLVRYIFWWIKGKVTFSEDEEIAKKHLSLLGYDDNTLSNPETTIDLLIHPVALLAMTPSPVGDCDDFSMLLATFLIALHIPCWYVTIAGDSNDPERLSHVYVCCRYPDEAGPIGIQYLDCSHGAYPGWEFRNGEVSRKILWKIN